MELDETGENLELDESEGDDEAEAQPPPVPVLDEHDAAAVMALLIRSVRIDDELTRDRQLVDEINARIAANNLARSKTIAAYTVFGFDTGDSLWNSIWSAVGGDQYRRAIAIARGQEVPPLLEQMDGSGEETHELTSFDERRDGAVHVAPPKIKDAILDYLRAVGDSGATARQLRQHLFDAYRLNVHEKTPGMTLYRLLKEGLVRRDGRTWFAVRTTENKENEAPSGRTAGASDAGEAGTSPNENSSLF